MKKRFLVLLICILPLFFCCRTNSAAQRQNQVEKQREEKDKQAERLYEEGKDRHMKNQSKKTKDLMKASKEKSVKASYYKKQCFLKRWFTRKPKTCSQSSE